MKLVFKRILILFLIIISIFLFSCTKEEEIVDSDNLLITKYNGKSVSEYTIHTELQDKYLKGDYKLASVYAKADKELSKSLGVTIDFSSIVSDSKKYSFYLDLSDNFNNPCIIETENKSVTLYNLMIMKVYYYKVVTEDAASDTFAFIVKDNIMRNLDIDGVTNARDLGGYKVNGNRLNQGVIFRMSKFNEDESQNLLITDSGINELVNNLNIKTEVDLRSDEDNEYGGLTSSPLGESVNYIHISMKSGGNCILLNTLRIVDLFKVLGNSSSYPLVFHCSIGTDRTGMVSFLLLNLLGVSRDEVYHDYLFSNFAPIGRVRLASVIDDYYKTIESASGKNDKERTYNYLLSIGVSKTDLDNFIKIMTE